MNGESSPQQAVSDRSSCDSRSATSCPLNARESSIYLVRFVHSSEVALCRYEEQPLRSGQKVIAPSRYGKDLATVLGAVNPAALGESGSVLQIVRVANESDRTQYEQNLDFEKRAVDTCRRKSENHGLKMKVLSTHLLVEENKLLVFFTADGRIDFRELVRDLVTTFRMRIELRQIGVRDETRLLGGIGICGRVLCCHSYPNQMCSVSIKMAKEQNLSLGSTKVSGPCGRLMCCLSYEYEYYTGERRKFPKPGTIVKTEGNDYIVSDVNMISRKVVLTGKEAGMVVLSLEDLSFDADSKSWKASLTTDVEQP